MLNELEALRQKFLGAQEEAGIGTLAGLEGIAKGIAGNEEPIAEPVPEVPAASAKAVTPVSTRVPIAALPEGSKAGDKVTLMITGIDPVNQTATLTMDSRITPTTEGTESEFGVDKTMGPMDDLKSYLFQKTREHE